ncbi:DUF6879 family protein [Streptomyces sp. URMC 126]|uniref:DUF6879 family protein n=1 Tax=Streptomyces sp. URMC 126 TaxID=3423401 RepID=UPI003F1C09A3
MTSSSRSLGDLFAQFRREAFRLETLDDYGRSGNTEAYRTFLAGDPQPADYNAEWVAEVRSHTGQGKRVYRAHIVSRPLTTYLRYELGWGYRKNMSGGEEFFILDITDRPNPLAGAPDFWLFDSETAAVMRYDERGTFLGADVLSADASADYVRYRDEALAQAQPFGDWWAEHGE